MDRCYLAYGKNLIDDTNLVSQIDVGNAILFSQPMSCASVISSLVFYALDPLFFCKKQEISFGVKCCKTCSGRYFNY